MMKADQWRRSFDLQPPDRAQLLRRPVEEQGQACLTHSPQALPWLSSGRAAMREFGDTNSLVREPRTQTRGNSWRKVGPWATEADRAPIPEPGNQSASG